MFKLVKLGLMMMFIQTLSYQCITTQNQLFNLPEITLNDEQGNTHIVYQLEEKKLDGKYEQSVDFLDEVNNPYVRNIASLLYVGYPSNVPVNGFILNEQFNLSEEDEYLYEGISSHGAQLARGITQIALNDCIKLYSDQSLSTHEAFNGAVHEVKDYRRTYFSQYSEDLFSYYEALIDSAIYLQVSLNDNQNLSRILYYPSENGSALIGTSTLQEVSNQENPIPINQDSKKVNNIIYWILLFSFLLGFGSYYNYRRKHK